MNTGSSKIPRLEKTQINNQHVFKGMNLRTQAIYDRAKRKGASQASLDFLYRQLLDENIKITQMRQAQITKNINNKPLSVRKKWWKAIPPNNPTDKQRALAKLWMREKLLKFNKKKPLSIVAMEKEAGYTAITKSNRPFHKNRPMQRIGFKKALSDLLPQDDVIARIAKGLSNEDDKEALAYAKLGAEIHGLINQKAVNTSLMINAENITIASLMSPPEIPYQLEDGRE